MCFCLHTVVASTGLRDKTSESWKQGDLPVVIQGYAAGPPTSTTPWGRPASFFSLFPIEPAVARHLLQLHCDDPQATEAVLRARRLG